MIFLARKLAQALCFCGFLAAPALVTPAWAAGEPFVLAAGVTYPIGPLPEGLAPEAGEGPGFAEALVVAAFQRLGLEARAIGLPPERALVNANSGIEDGELLRVAGLERVYPNLIRVPEAVMDFEFVGFTLGPAFPVAGWQSLRPYHVGFVTGAKIIEQKLAEGRSLTRADDQEQLFAQLGKARIDVALVERWQGLWQARKLGLKVTLLEPPFLRVPLFLYLNRRHEALVPRLAAAIAAVKAEPGYRALREQILAPLARTAEPPA